MRLLSQTLCLTLLSTGVRLFAAQTSADVAHLHVQLVVPSSTLPRGAASSAGLYFKLEARLARLLDERRRLRRAAPHPLDPPRRHHRRPARVPSPQRLPLGPLMDFGYENEVLFPFTLTADSSAAARPGHPRTRTSTGSSAAKSASPAKPILKSRAPSPPSLGTSTPVEPDTSLFARLGNNLPQPLPLSDKLGFVPTPAGSA